MFNNCKRIIPFTSIAMDFYKISKGVDMKTREFLTFIMKLYVKCANHTAGKVIIYRYFLVNGKNILHASETDVHS